ncbi:AraC family transcriptional regulator [Aquimarina sp. AU119]|uniref:AraC family transcriptional regulator n=1 Tax=Aquimarina sp. AU119 TaxID=2108528 RepID=UPI000D68AFDC|nr:AraC family transcriptional regulator [Aquimarina sp. AU119]
MKLRSRHINFSLLVITLLLSNAIYSQKQQDSLTQYYKLSKADSLPIPIRLEYINSFLKGAYSSQQDSLIYIGLMRKTRLLGQVKQYDSAIIYTRQLYDLAIEKKDTLYVQKALLKFGIYHKKSNQLATSFKYHTERFKLSKITKDTITLGRSLLDMANIQTSLGDFSGSKTTAIDGVRYLEKTADLRNLAGLYHIISVANKESKRYDEARRYNERALALGKDSFSINTIGIKNILIFKNTKALILAAEGQYQEAIRLLKTLESDTILQQDKNEYARVLSNLGHLQWVDGKENKYSEKLLLKGLALRNEINDVGGLMSSNIHLTRYYFEKDRSKALKYAEAAYKNAKIRGDLVFIIKALGYIFKLKENVSKEAIVYDQIHHKLQEINQKNREIYAVTKYENEKLTNKNVILTKEKDKLTDQAWIISLLLVVSMTGVGYYYYRQQIYKKRFIQLLGKDENKNTIKTSAIYKTGVSSSISEEALEHLLTQLQQFEDQKGYLTPNINAKDLAKSFGSNSSYLSIVINTYKQKSISQYINDLRIGFAIDKLQSDATFRKYTIKAIAKDVGFNSSEIFAKKFYKNTGIYPSYFIKKLEM